MKKVLYFVLLAAAAAVTWAGGAKEESSVGRSDYLAQRGYIAPAEEIYPSSFIGKVDYAYPQPDDMFGVTAYTGHRQVSSAGQEELIVIGLQGKEVPFKDLPLLNLAFVIDKSGSMSSADKMSWVKESFEIFIEQVRDQDFVSLVVFDSDARVIFPSTRIGGNREHFLQVVRSIAPGGGTNLTDGLRLGYKQVMANFRKKYVNRVLFLTDGVGDSNGIFDMAQAYRKLGVNVSTIGLGHNFDLNLMRRLAEDGGGSSRFISDRKRMLETFGRGLSRMIVPTATDVSVEVELLAGVSLIDTWAYEHRQSGSKIIYPFPTLHVGDYETIVLKVAVPPKKVTGPFTICHIQTAYTDSHGKYFEAEPIEVQVDIVVLENPVDGISNAIVLRAGTMLHLAEGLKEIGEKYYGGKHLQVEERRDLVQFLLGKTNTIKKEILNTRERLDFEGFDEELALLDNYIKIFGKELEMDAASLEAVRQDRELKPVTRKRDLVDRIAALFNEMTLDLQSRMVGNIAVSGFAVSDGRKAGITDLLDEMAQSAFGNHFTVVDRRMIETVLAEQQLSLSDLMETTEAIKVGRVLSADYILTGTVIPMSSSVVIFGRIIDTESTVVESAAQVIVPIDAELRALL